MKTHKITAFVRGLAAAIVVLCMMCMLPLAVLAETTNQAVMADTTGVVHVRLVYVDPSNRTEHPIQNGTGFLINDSTVITCNHVIALTDEQLAQAAEKFGTDANTVKNNCKVKIGVLRDMTIDASIKNASAEMDFAILNLNEQIYNRTYLPLRPSSDVQQTEEVFALGFNIEAEMFQDVRTYTSEDVSISSGRVSKLIHLDGVDYVQSSARITYGNSGGPLVDTNGNVIGVCQGGVGGEDSTDSSFSIAIDQVIESLDALGIEYNSTPGPTAQPTDVPETTEAPSSEVETTVDKSGLQALVADMQDMDTASYDKESAEAFTTALQAAQTVLADEQATQEQVDSARDQLNSAFSALAPAGNNVMLFVIIGVVAAVVIILIVLIVVLSGKKKPQVQDLPYPTEQPPVPVGSGAGNIGGFADVKPVIPPEPQFAQGGFGGGETTVLNQGAGETTVLNQASNFGYLIRSRNNERININNASFMIGKERAKVNYCVTDNTSVSRTHAVITHRGTMAYIKDMNATNGTFVNGVRLSAGQESPLNPNDRITLADEEFVYYC